MSDGTENTPRELDELARESFKLPAEIRERMAGYETWLGPIGLQRFEEWMRAEFMRGAAAAHASVARRLTSLADYVDSALADDQSDRQIIAENVSTSLRYIVRSPE